MSGVMSFLRLLLVGIVPLLLFVLQGESPQSANAGTSYLVNSNGDLPDAAVDGLCDVDLGANGQQCTLRAVLGIAEANTSISFNLPNCPGNGCTITPATNLPEVDATDVEIDGTSQPGYTGDPLVYLSGLGGASNGLSMFGDNPTVTGLRIEGFSSHGIFSSGDIQGGLTITHNYIANNGGDGIVLPQGDGSKGANLISDNIIDGNGLAGIDGYYCPEPTMYLRNIVTGHTTAGQPGILTCGPNQEVHFNYIAGNAIGLKQRRTDTTNAQNNWWRCNGGPASASCDSTEGLVDSDPWLMLSFDASPGTIEVGQTSTLTADFNVNSDFTDTSAMGYLPDGIDVLFSTDLGSVGSPSVLKQTSSGVATATLTGDGGTGTAHVSALNENETQQDTVIIEPASTPSPTPSPTASPSPSPSPSPTAPAADHKQGDLNCDDKIDGLDALIALLAKFGLAGEHNDCPDLGSGSPKFGDVNCSGLIDENDALAILTFKADPAGLPHQETCTDLGEVLPT